MNNDSAYRQAIDNNRLLSKIVIGLFSTVVLLCIVIATAFPLKEKEYLIYEFSSDANTFARIGKANSTLTANTALAQTLLRAYVKNREEINHTNDQERFASVLSMSGAKVARQFKLLLETINYADDRNRSITINSDNPVGGFKSRIHQVHFTTVDTNQNNKNGITKKWTATIKYTFQSQKVRVDKIHFNPVGIQITAYAISERTE